MFFSSRMLWAWFCCLGTLKAAKKKSKAMLIFASTNFNPYKIFSLSALLKTSYLNSIRKVLLLKFYMNLFLHYWIYVYVFRQMLNVILSCACRSLVITTNFIYSTLKYFSFFWVLSTLIFFFKFIEITLNLSIWFIFL